MGGNDDDSRSDLDKWLDTQSREMDKIRQQFHDSFDKELRNWADDASPSTSRGPFERFKSFIDSNFTTFSEGFRNFPSNVTELKTRMQQEREARRQEELDVWQRWTGSEDSPDHIKMQVERQSSDERQAVKESTYMLLRESYERNKHVPPSKILQLFRDPETSFGPLDQFATPMLSMGGACYYKTETVENLPSTARWSWSTHQPQWLSVNWFKRSIYSPIQLEANHAFEESGVNWRAAFEDLLSATLDKPMVSAEKVGQRVPYGKPQSTYRGPGLEWMLSLQCRGILPPQLPSLYKPVALFDGFDEVKRPRTVEFMHDLDQITSNSKSARMYPGVKRDLNLLMDEVATKSGPTTEAKPLRIVQTPWRVPETEQDLYDAMPPYTDLVKPENPTKQGVPKATGDIERDLDVIGDSMEYALRTSDYESAARCLDTYYGTHGEVSTLIDAVWPIDDVMDASHPPLMEALKRSNLPHDDVCKRDAVNYLRYLREMSGEAEREEEEVQRRNTARLDREKQDELLAPERTARSSAVATSSKTEGTKKPDILSQLTTTHTTRMPDGTVTTKVVLKQRFADGSEETHESVQTSRGEASQLESAKQELVEERPKKRGWFWN